MTAGALRLPAALPSLTAYGFKTYSLIAALVIYALAGTPTPDNPGWIEVVIGVLLVVAVGVSGVYNAINPPSNTPNWQKYGRYLLVFGIFSPVLVGFLENNDVNLVFRDVLSFIFMVFPLFLTFLWRCKQVKPQFFIFLSVFIGVCFAIRAILPLGADGLLVFLTTPGLNYFANLPTVLFSALFLSGSFIFMAAGVSEKRRVLPALALLGLAIIPFAAMAMSLQRATIGASCLYLAAILLYAFTRRPYRAVVPCAMIAALALALWPLLTELGVALEAKSAAVGLNMRWQEAQAVWEVVTGNPLSLLFGMGWGATFHSPAVAGVNVNFTHSLITAMLLKTGLCGLSLTLFYLAALGRELLRLALNMPVLGLALAAPILINVLLYASYKSLDFGIVLLLIPLSVQMMQTRAPRKS